VVLLDETIRAVEHAGGAAPGCWRVAAVKFLRAVGPGESLLLRQEQLASGAIRFTILSAGQAVATGALSPA
jgi:hypothetical protein